MNALDRIAKLMSRIATRILWRRLGGSDRHRWLTTGMLAASASSTNVGYLTHKVIRSLGILSFDNQARV